MVFQAIYENSAQYVAIEDQVSDLLPALCTYASGKCCEPLIFIIYINDLFFSA